MDKRGNNSSSVNWKRIVGIIAAIVVIIILILSLISCQKKKSNSDKPKERKVEEKDKKPKKKDKDDKKLDVVDTNTSFAVNTTFSTKTATPTKTSKKSSGGSVKPTPTPVVKYDTEVTLNGGDKTLEYKEESYSEEGAKYTNKKNNVIVSSGDVDDIKTYKDGEEVGALNADSPVGEYQVVYSYTNPDGETVTATRNVTIQDTTAPTITSSKSITGNTATITLTITDHSEIGEVSVVGAQSGEVTLGENYSFTTEVNDTFTVTAKDVYENTSTKTLSVNELITETDLTNAITVNNQSRRVYKKNGENTTVTDMRYASTNTNYSSSVDTSTFKNPETGQYYTRATIGGRDRDVTVVTGNRTGQLDRNEYHYVYYEVTKTKTDGDTTYTATAANVQTVHFN